MAKVIACAHGIKNWSVIDHHGRELRAYRSRVLADDLADKLNRAELVTVDYRDADHEWSETYRGLGEAAQVASIIVQWGAYPTIRAKGFTVYPVRDRRTGRTEWAFAFSSDGMFKSQACRIAETAGVRYRSHRKGYRASERAWRAFCAMWQARSLPAIEPELWT